MKLTVEIAYQKAIFINTIMIMFFTSSVIAQQAAQIHYSNDFPNQTIYVDSIALIQQQVIINQATNESLDLSDIEKVLIKTDVFVPKTVEVTNHKTEEVKESKILLKKLIGGTINFYSFLDKEMKYHFYIEKDTIVQEITGKSDVTDLSEKLENQQRGIFNYLLNDCKAISKKKIQRLSISKKAMLEVIKNYNKSCGSLDYEESKITSSFYLKAGALIGYGYQYSAFQNQLQRPIDSNMYGPHNNRYAGFGAKYGLFLIIPVKKLHRNQKIELTVHAFHDGTVKDDYLFFDDSILGDTTTIEHRIEASYFEVGFLLQYVKPLRNNNFKQVIALGVNGRSIYNTKVNQGERKFSLNGNGLVTTSTFVSVPNTPNWNPVIHAQYGIQYKKFQFNLNSRFGRGGVSGENQEFRFAGSFDVRYQIF